MGCPYKKHDHYIDFQFRYCNFLLFVSEKVRFAPLPLFLIVDPPPYFGLIPFPLTHGSSFKFFSRKILFYADLVSALLYPRKTWRPSWEGHVGSINNCVEPDDLFSAIPCGVCLPLTKKRVFHLPPPIYQTMRRGQSFINV